MRAQLALVLLLSTSTLVQMAAGQQLAPTCARVAAARCPGQCAATPSGPPTTAGCSPAPKRRALAETTEAAEESSQRLISANSAPRADWQLSQPLSAVAQAGAMPPQRVLPYGLSGKEAPETPEQQQAIISHLQELLAKPEQPAAAAAAAAGGVPAGANASQPARSLLGDGECTAGAEGEDPTCDALPTEDPLGATDDAAEPIAEPALAAERSAAAAAAAAGAAETGEATTDAAAAAATTPARRALLANTAAYTGPTSLVTRSLTFLGNTKIKVGVDLARAGAISWVSSPLAPAPWKDVNLINTWDQGRLLQQSFYGCVDGSCWASRPWLWNPVQGGSWENVPGQTTKKEVVAGKRIYAEGWPRNWGGQDLIKSVTFSQDLSLLDNVAAVKFTMSYSGTTTHPYMTQEVPAVFVDRKFSVLAFYNGTKPWTNDPAVRYVFPPGSNVFARPTEFWAAYIDPATGWGLGVYNPMAWMGITAYRIGPDGAASRPWDCSYFAQTIRMQLHPGMKAYPYTIYITVGRLDAIRATFAKLRTSPAVLAASAATTAATKSLGPIDARQAAADAVPGPVAGQPDLGRNAWYGAPLNYSGLSYLEVPDGTAAATPAAGGPAAAPQLGVQGDGAAPGGRAGPSDDGVGAGTGGAAPGEQGQAGAGAARQRGVAAGAVVGAVAGCALLAGLAGVAVTRKRKRDVYEAGGEPQPASRAGDARGTAVAGAPAGRSGTAHAGGDEALAAATRTAAQLAARRSSG